MDDRFLKEKLPRFYTAIHRVRSVYGNDKILVGTLHR